MSDNGDKLSLNFVKFDSPVEFVQDTDTMGLSLKFGKYNLPIRVDDVRGKIDDLALRHGALFPVKGEDTLYLKMRSLSKKQKKDILDQGPMSVKVQFLCVGYYRNSENEEKYLTFRVEKLGKSDVNNFAPSDW